VDRPIGIVSGVRQRPSGGVKNPGTIHPRRERYSRRGVNFLQQPLAVRTGQTCALIVNAPSSSSTGLCAASTPRSALNVLSTGGSISIAARAPWSSASAKRVLVEHPACWQPSVGAIFPRSGYGGATVPGNAHRCRPWPVPSYGRPRPIMGRDEHARQPLSREDPADASQVSKSSSVGLVTLTSIPNRYFAQGFS
jgi:hypothetical protein